MATEPAEGLVRVGSKLYLDPDDVLDVFSSRGRDFNTKAEYEKTFIATESQGNIETDWPAQRVRDAVDVPPMGA